jgi:ParB family protein of integrating conjugative element (PFGI_1 class)
MANHKLPPGTSIPVIAANLQARGNGKKPDAASSNVTPMNEAQRRLAAAKSSIAAGDALKQPPRHLNAHQDVPGFGVLTLEQLRPYDRNPRVTRNPAYFELKESIKANGFKGTLAVTRRPHDTTYMVSSGGNTRLAVLNELYSETGDKRYYEIPVTHEPYVKESQLIANHLIENEVRGDTTFWEKASGLIQLRNELEQEQGKPISYRGFEAILKEMGLSTTTSTINYYQFAVERLSKIGQYTPSLARNHVRETLQPQFTRLADLARIYRVPEDIFQSKIVDTANEAYAATYQEGLEFDPAELLLLWEKHLSQALGKSEHWLQRALHLRGTFDQLTGPEIDDRIRDEEERARAKREALTTVPPTTPQGGLPLIESGSSDPSAATVGTTLPSRAVAQMQPSTDMSTEAPVGKTTDVASPAVLPTAVGLDRMGQLLRYVLQQARAMVEGTGYEDCIVQVLEMPCGFFIELPQVDINNPVHLRRAADHHGAWWLVASVTEQTNMDWMPMLPKSSLWRKAKLLDGLTGIESERAIMQAVLDRPDFDILTGWLCNPNRPLGGLYLPLVESVRALREAAPARFKRDESPFSRIST